MTSVVLRSLSGVEGIQQIFLQAVECGLIGDGAARWRRQVENIVDLFAQGLNFRVGDIDIHFSDDIGDDR